VKPRFKLTSQGHGLDCESLAFTTRPGASFVLGFVTVALYVSDQALILVCKRKQIGLGQARDDSKVKHSLQYSFYL